MKRLENHTSTVLLLYHLTFSFSCTNLGLVYMEAGKDGGGHEVSYAMQPPPGQTLILCISGALQLFVSFSWSMCRVPSTLSSFRPPHHHSMLMAIQQSPDRSFQVIPLHPETSPPATWLGMTNRPQQPCSLWLPRAISARCNLFFSLKISDGTCHAPSHISASLTRLTEHTLSFPLPVSPRLPNDHALGLCA